MNRPTLPFVVGAACAVLAQTGASALGVYGGKLAFYMPGNWRAVVSVTGAGVAPSVTTFPIFLDPSTPAP